MKCIIKLNDNKRFINNFNTENIKILPKNCKLITELDHYNIKSLEIIHDNFCPVFFNTNNFYNEYIENSDNCCIDISLKLFLLSSIEKMSNKIRQSILEEKCEFFFEKIKYQSINLIKLIKYSKTINPFDDDILLNEKISLLQKSKEEILNIKFDICNLLDKYQKPVLNEIMHI